MNADLRELNGVDTHPAEGGTLRAERVTGTPKASPQPPPPPPPPAHKRSKADKAKRAIIGRVERLPIRYQIAGAGIAVVSCTVLAVRMFVHPVDEKAVARDAAQQAYAAVSAELQQAKAESTQIAVPSALSWATCPLTTEARVMIGGDPATGGRTPNPERAGIVDTQARALLQTFTITELRLTAPTQSGLRVVADDPSAGVPLFTCPVGNAAPATSTTVAAG